VVVPELGAYTADTRSGRLQPRDEKVHQIVNAVRKVESSGGTLKAMGSQWSYSGVAVDSTTQAVIDTDQLNSILSNVIPFALLANPTKAAKYVHVEAASSCGTSTAASR